MPSFHTRTWQKHLKNWDKRLSWPEDKGLHIWKQKHFSVWGEYKRTECVTGMQMNTEHSRKYISFWDPISLEKDRRQKKCFHKNSEFIINRIFGKEILKCQFWYFGIYNERGGVLGQGMGLWLKSWLLGMGVTSHESTATRLRITMHSPFSF
mgnify:CR=1 FL=1